jgi:membrane-associated protein
VFALIDFLIHIDRNLPVVIDHFGIWTYVILFIIIVLETGLVITPFLPGDSLLFVTGAAAATGLLDIYWLIVIFIVASIVGDTLNYWIGHYVGVKVLMNRFPDLVKKEYIDRTYGYFEKYGGKTIFIARFIPLVRTFAPFLAGVGQMAYKKFLLYNVLGAVTWVLITTLAGYLLGSHPIISENINILIYGVIAVTLVTVILIFAGLIRSFLHRKTPVR